MTCSIRPQFNTGNHSIINLYSPLVPAQQSKCISTKKKTLFHKIFLNCPPPASATSIDHSNHKLKIPKIKLYFIFCAHAPSTSPKHTLLLPYCTLYSGLHCQYVTVPYNILPSEFSILTLTLLISCIQSNNLLTGLNRLLHFEFLHS